MSSDSQTSLDLNGSWKNSYGSLMTLSVQIDGSIIGTYSSTTGSSGTYNITGHTLPNQPQPENGLAVVLSIYWHPINHEAPNSSWHWVSTYCGQLLTSGDLVVINSLVATSEFSGFSPGSYIDQLTFAKTENHFLKKEFAISDLTTSNTSTNPINGQWKDQDGNLSLTLQVTNEQYGVIKGEATYQQNPLSFSGFTDTNPGDLTLQSLSICGYSSESQTPISLSGWLDLSNSTLILSQWNANSTSVDERYYQSSLASWSLKQDS